jgi:uncharacterized Zn finger protein (UPF0148 family)
MDNLFDKYEKYILTEPEDEDINDWVISLLKLRGAKIIDNSCKECNVETMSLPNKRVCPECGITSNEFNTVQNFKKTLPYKRMTHFKDWLIKTQAKHCPNIHPDIINLVKNSNIDITYKNVKNILKRNNLSKHYEDIWYIMTYINPNIEVFRLTNDEENRLCFLFIKVQQIWDRIKPKDRKSIISYPFIITELLDIINRPDLKKFFYLPRFNKVFEYKIMWNRIMRNLYDGSTSPTHKVGF